MFCVWFPLIVVLCIIVSWLQFGLISLKDIVPEVLRFVRTAMFFFKQAVLVQTFLIVLS